MGMTIWICMNVSMYAYKCVCVYVHVLVHCICKSVYHLHTQIKAACEAKLQTVHTESLFHPGHILHLVKSRTSK